MKKTLFIILMLMLVFTMAMPVALGAPETSPTATPTDASQGTDPEEEPQTDPNATPDPNTTTTASGFQMITLESQGIPVFRIQMRLRDLGYLNYRPTGLYYTMTQAAVQDFQVNNALDADGRIGEMTYAKLFASDALRKPLDAATASKVKSGPSLVGSEPTPGEAADWATVVDTAFAVGTTATITDYNSGKKFTVKRTGGTGHADVETTDQDAYDMFLQCFGGEPNWEKRSVLVTVGTATYAASLFGNPSGSDTIAENGMAGHTCLYFSGSTSDVLGFTDKEHQKMVLRAAGKPLVY